MDANNPEKQQHQDDEADFDSMLDDCSKDLDKKLTLNVNAQQPSMAHQASSGQDPFDFSKMAAAGEIGEGDMQEASKIFADMLKNMEGGNPTGETNPESNPFLQAAKEMFKDFEQMSKEQPAKGMPGMPGGMPGGEGFPGMDDPMFKDLMSNFAKDMMSGDGNPDQSDQAMENLMSEFTSFLKSSENNEEMKSALESVVQEIISKDTLYEPMKVLHDEFPNWLESNWDKVSQKDLERYNKQVDKIEDIVKFYEAGLDATDKQKAFELLGELQELGSPPEDLMKKIAGKQFAGGNTGAAGL